MVCAVRKIGAVYRPRQRLESDLHRLVHEHFDDFQTVYDQRYRRKFGFWRSVVTKTVTKFLSCGDLRLGFARGRCPDCRHEFFVAFSCKQRCICPSCDQKRALLLGMHVAEDICEAVGHRQFVWTIPKRLRIFFRFDRSLLGKLPPLAWRTIIEVYQAVLGRQDMVPGMISGIQTFGQLIHYHPHIHALVTEGAFTRDGTFVPLPEIDTEPFLKLWQKKVFDLLLEEGKIDQTLVDQMSQWRHSF